MSSQHHDPVMVDMTQLTARRAADPNQLRQLYQSLPLTPNARCIRTLDVFYCEDAEAPLSATLRVVDLQTSPAFTALSYTWGPSGGSNTIRCNNVDVPVTANCHEALLALARIHSGRPRVNRPRRRDVETTGLFTVWVDAICINQNDYGEKETQIPLMREVYTWAHAVYVWLGPGNECKRRTAAWLSIAHGRKSILSGISWSDDRTSRLPTVRRDVIRAVVNSLRIHCTPWFCLPRRPEPADFEAFLECEWLYRIWTFQELIFASNPIMVYGNDTIRWDSLAGGLGTLKIEYLSRIRKLKCRPTVNRPTIDAHLSVLPCIQKWLGLFDTWLSIDRSSSWNGVVRRELPSDKKIQEEEDSQDCMPVQRYRHYLLYHWCVKYTRVFLVSSCYFFLMAAAVGLFGLGLFSLTQIGQEDGDWVWGLLGLPGGTSVFGIGHAVMEHLDNVRRLSALDYKSADNLGAAQALIGLLQAVRERKATVAYDRVYAMYGVLDKLGAATFEPDYSQPVGRVYRDFFASMLARWPATISLLIDVGGPPPPGGPSWVPDWDTLSCRAWLPGEKVYSAVQDDVASSAVVVTVSDSEMSVRGIALGAVSFSTGPVEACVCGVGLSLGDVELGHGLGNVELDSPPIPPFCESCLAVALLALSEWLMAIKKDMPVGRSYDSIPRAVFDTLAGYAGVDSLPSAPRLANEGFNHWYRIAVDEALQPALSADARAQRLLDILGGDTEALVFAIRCIERLAGRRGLFFSRDGHIGSGTPSVAKDDVIFILDGVKAPMILRTAGAGAGLEKYTVVGPAFIRAYLDLSTFQPAGINREWQSVVLV